MNGQNQQTNRSVAAAAASNVDGYLRNASKRVRIPTAEGGRGTRRKLAMVTAANVDTPPDTMIAQGTSSTSAQPNDVAFTDLDDEWDEVMLPNAVVDIKKDKIKPEKYNTASSHTIKTDNTVLSPARPTDTVKTEIVDVDANEELQEQNLAGPELADGTRPPLSGTPIRRWGAPRDPALERAVEQQQFAAAQRRLERIRRTAEGLTRIIFALQRGRCVLRESRHPQLLRKILCMRRADGKFPLLRAAQDAREAYCRALEPSARRPSLAPCWVTISRDTVGNYTSAAITALLAGIASTFALDDTHVDNSLLMEWTTPIRNQHLLGLLRSGRLPMGGRIVLPHTIHMCAVFLSLATVTGLSCRLVVALARQKEKAQEEQEEQEATNDGLDNSATVKKMSLFSKKGKRPRVESGSNEFSHKLPSSCYWIEVWCPQREGFISVNPCEGCTTLWGAPYTFAVAGDAVVDVTPRYSTKYSSAFAYRLGRCDQFRFFWRHLSWNDNREASQVIVDEFCKDPSKVTLAQLERERKQLNALTYAEEIPKTLTALTRHPLFVLERELARYEGVYPKDRTSIVGSVKGHTVYKRFAVVNLRSRDGWLREGRSIISEDEPPYKIVPPPASKPFASPSAFFGIWQTKPFEPQPLREDGSLPRHGKTLWYIVLDKPLPSGLVQFKYPNIVRVARRIGVEFGLAVMGFVRRRLSERRFSNWEASIDGIVVKETDADKLLHAYEDWRQLMDEQEAAKRRQRSNRWWLHFAQRMLAFQRVREQYLEGAMHGTLPLR